MSVSLSDFLPDASLLSMESLELLIRIVVAAVLGIIIGVERTRRQKDAGTRTHCIIAVTAAAFMIISKYAFADVEGILGAKTADPARISAQVVSGISFLGAGVIFKDRNSSVKGLTTAAGIWATAAVGMAAGAGMYWLSIFETLIVTVSQTLLHRFPIGNDAMQTQEITLRYADNPEIQAKIDDLLKSHGGTVEQSDISRQDNVITMVLMVRLKKPITYEESLALLEAQKDLYQVCI